VILFASTLPARGLHRASERSAAESPAHTSHSAELAQRSPLDSKRTRSAACSLRSSARFVGLTERSVGERARTRSQLRSRSRSCAGVGCRALAGVRGRPHAARPDAVRDERATSNRSAERDGRSRGGGGTVKPGGVRCSFDGCFTGVASAYADGEGVAVPEQSPVVGAELTTGVAVGEGLHDQTGFGDPCAARITSARALLVCAHHVHMHVNTRDRAMGESNRLTALDALMVVRRSRFSSKISKVPIGSCDTPRITVDAGSGFKRWEVP
jgi:hypothetical protein